MGNTIPCGTEWLAVIRQEPFLAPMLGSYQRAAQALAGQAVLDFGCGYGWGAYLLAGRCAAVTGYDPDCGRIQAAKAAFITPNLAFCAAPAPLEGGQFGGICAFQVLQHLPDPLGSLLFLLRCLAPGKTLHISTKTSCTKAVNALEQFRQHSQVQLLYDRSYPLPGGQRLAEAGFARRGGACWGGGGDETDGSVHL